ncbi:DNA-binding XRE family transcriptional regulator [Camelimonas lactis]|uniref:DNA-binding XRE family transcriptional regulator n=2 Tax=Camelimonas lactis TaxID=659006 RepID=A0A4R2GHR2_9HYPH|nr:DNA-binding XRE family transcriptional regulator [Camelimonas lactis]
MPPPMEAQQLVAWNLRRLRVAKGVSQDDLALSAEIERAYVGYLERGKRNPTVVTLEKLSNALGIHISELFTEPEGDVAPITPLRAGRKKK